MKLFIACSSSDDISEYYFIECEKYLEEIFQEDHDLVFGAYNKGLMRVSYEIALKYNRQVIGITPKIFENDLKELNCNKEIITDNINRRTEQAIEESDALIFMPGGIGTIYELFTALESKRSAEFNKPIIIYNANNYFDKLLIFIDEIYNQKFSSPIIKDCYYISNSATDTLNYLKNYNLKK